MFRIRKWGWYLTVFRWPGLKIKFLYFRGDRSISLQRHFLRTEDWCVVVGSGLMEMGRAKHILQRSWMYRGDRAFIGVKDWHRFTSYGPTLILEVQKGVCNEKDIERA